MLEYGELDLDEYLAEDNPPLSNEEIIAFWEGLFTVADTLKRIHHLRDDRGQFYRGWHGDVKPDNILRVRGEYRLADFGFARFIREKPGKTTTYLLGGTRTYGAPECDRRARDGTLTPYSQTIGTWSYGCVLSAVAIWVVLGPQAYEKYRTRRVMAIKEIQQRKMVDKAVSVPSCDDAFHDGRTVIPAVTEWHNHLRNSLRKADAITQRILDIIDQSMLIIIEAR
ncbi:hypothetical protein VM1G_11686 [Cytospora mali]|uniref:Protein kinase domain-containing protein n=1 Tax=Cytospora mali TaxID=578113 RepID=A0A194W0P1_CYTMA|nr:hypothetical protein VM1G_11686 [Valsa mali]